MARVFKLLQPFAIDRARATTALAAKRLRTAMGKLRDYIEGQSAHHFNVLESAATDERVAA